MIFQAVTSALVFLGLLAILYWWYSKNKLSKALEELPSPEAYNEENQP